MPESFRIDIPLLPESFAGSALQFVDLLRAANQLARQREGGRAAHLHWRLLDAQGRPGSGTGAPGWLAPYLGNEGPPTARPLAVYLPPLHAADVPSLQAALARHGALCDALRQAVAAGGTVATLGNAAWFAARAGLPAPAGVALPWFYVAAFRREFPQLAIAPSEAADGGAWCSGATLHGLGRLVAMLVQRSMGEAMARTCAKAFDSDLARTRVAAGAAAQIPVTRSGTLARAIEWMEEHLAQPYSLERVAAAAAVSPRTLLRHFRQEVGRSPLDLLHALRCERAQVLLEITLESVPSIAAACGYADPTAFRRVFARHAGTTPAEYRARHTMRAPRARWRVDPRRLAVRE
jgi:transcriptional regulator GlxA family with amidase domain